MKETKKQENKKTNEKELDFKLVHTGTQIVAPWNFTRNDETVGYKK